MTPPDCQFVELTPERAREILQANTRNRPLRSVYVEKLAQAMRRGEWTVNGEPIQIAGDGTLLNGQHRLCAVVQSGVTIPVLLVTGLSVEALRNMDTGTRRNLSDVLALRGEIDTTNLAAALGLLYRNRNGARMDGAGRTAPTMHEALKLLEAEPEIRGAVKTARRLYRQNHMRLSVMAVLLYLFNEADPGAGTSFFEALCFPDQTPESPIRALQSILERSRSDRTYRLPPYSLCAMTIKAFNAWSNGTSIAVLSFRPGGDSPEPFPEIRPAIASAAQ